MIQPLAMRRFRTLALAIALSPGASVVEAQQDALVIEQDAVKLSTDLQVTGAALLGNNLHVAGTANAGRFRGVGAMPVGAILMWSGAVDQLPAGWVLCDGRALAGGGNAPDLSGRFIVGYDAKNAEYASNKTGGEARHTLSIEEMPKHTHEASTEGAGQHTHALSVSEQGWAFHNWVASGDPGKLPTSRQQIQAAGQHVHRVNLKEAGSGRPFDNRPPYLVLAYIMFTGQ